MASLPTAPLLLSFALVLVKGHILNEAVEFGRSERLRGAGGIKQPPPPTPNLHQSPHSREGNMIKGKRQDIKSLSS